MHKFLFYNKFIIFLYMFRALLYSSSRCQILLYSIWYRRTECRYEWHKRKPLTFFSFTHPLEPNTHFVMCFIANALYTLLHYTLYKAYNAVAIKHITKWVLGSSGCVNEKKVKDLRLCHSYLKSVWRYQMLYNTIWPPDDEHNNARNM